MTDRVELGQGDSRELLQALEAASLDACICDPPYELNFLNNAWDNSGIAFDATFWREVYRVLKPGAHLLAFGGTRTYHRIACAIEDAGFEIRDTIEWMYYSGFPKSHNISKALDRQSGAEREKVRLPGNLVRTPAQINSGWHETLMPAQQAALERGWHEVDGPEPVTDEARLWNGWGSALKPAHEPIIVARKPMAEKTLAANTLRFGTGGINVEGSREPADDDYADVWDKPMHTNVSQPGWQYGVQYDRERTAQDLSAYKPVGGRWPSNAVVTCCGTLPHAPGCPALELARQHDDHLPDPLSSADWTAEDLPAFFLATKPSERERDLGLGTVPKLRGTVERGHIDSPAHRGMKLRRNFHPTVKPLALMRWLARLVTPRDGVVLDPFMGSGTTGMGAVLEGFGFVGYELSPEFFEIAARRIEHARDIYTPDLLTLASVDDETAGVPSGPGDRGVPKCHPGGANLAEGGAKMSPPVLTVINQSLNGSGAQRQTRAARSRFIQTAVDLDAAA